ncbi:DNA ligase [Biomphalaria pfeifferi]|uniref:DNA ligase n=1 Tax=Biomphalaria pfeifferi TaxID=112525 RepID=A0AAD8FEA9_BIOPF|nr:DNA ligase [Biomphalaria pfeifferi]
MHLDGELFGGWGQFQSTVSIAKTPQSPKWNDIKYCVFDSPSMGKKVFKTRMQRIKEYFEDVKLVLFV